ncbi:MAG: hypothetical protein M3Y72_15650 [Acidobacteriota bacterium]|nr:hypothetical protein [Acidobacteriota bacterium]MDQ2842447.1 hypothetical protein [Acidobacteriota bacterium]
MSTSSELGRRDGTTGERLGSWKEIATFLGRDVRTVQRWEKVEGLPIHRHRHAKLDTVYAFREELLQWQDSRGRIGVSPDERSAPPMGPGPAIELPAPPAHDAGQKPSRTVFLKSVAAIAALAVTVSVFLLSVKRSRHPGIQTSAGAAPLVANLGEQLSPSFSPDGRRVAFVWNGESQDNYDIYVASIDHPALAPVRLTKDAAIDYSPAWSPDGKWIAFCRGTEKAGGSLWMMPASGGTEHKITSLNSIAISSAKSLSWAPDSGFLVSSASFSSGDENGLYLVNIRTGAHRLLTQSPAGENDVAPAVSPDGRVLAFERDTGRGVSSIALLPFHTDNRVRGDARILTWPGFDHLSNGGPAWTPDSRAIVFDSNKGGDSHLWVVPIDRSDIPKLLPYGGDVQNAAISVRGRLAFQHQPLNANIWKLDVRSLLSGKDTNPTRVLASTRIADSPAVSPDGQKLVFSSNRAGYMELWTSDVNGTDVTPLTAMKASSGSPSWSPDGRLVAYDVRVAAKPQIFTIPAGGGRSISLTDGQHADVVPYFSPDGRWIYFSSNRTRTIQIWKMTATGAAVEQVTHSGGFAGMFSPNGKYLYYSKQNTPFSSVWRESLATGREELLVPSVVNRAFVPTDTGLFYVSQSGDKPRSLFFLSFESRVNRLLFSFDKSIRLGLALSRDKRFLFYSQVDQSSQDLQLVRDFWR